MKTVWHIRMSPEQPLREYQGTIATVRALGDDMDGPRHVCGDHLADVCTASWTLCIAHYEATRRAWIDPFAGTISDERYALPIYTHAGPVALGSFCSPYSLRACVRWLTRHSLAPDSLDEYASDYLHFLTRRRSDEFRLSRMNGPPPLAGKPDSPSARNNFLASWCGLFERATFTGGCWGLPTGRNRPWVSDYDHVNAAGSFAGCRTTSDCEARADYILRKWGRKPPDCLPNISSLILAPEPHEFASMALAACEQTMADLGDGYVIL